MTTRREMLQLIGAAPVAVMAPVVVADEPAVEPFWPTIEHVFDVPASAGPVVSMIGYRDSVYVATKFGGVYRISMEGP